MKEASRPVLTAQQRPLCSNNHDWQIQLDAKTETPSKVLKRFQTFFCLFLFLIFCSTGWVVCCRCVISCCCVFLHSIVGNDSPPKKTFFLNLRIFYLNLFLTVKNDLQLVFEEDKILEITFLLTLIEVYVLNRQKRTFRVFAN